MTAITKPYSYRVAYFVVLAGVCAALHVWKLPPALPALQQELGLNLVESSFLLSLVQVAGMLFGLIAGLVAVKMGLRRCMLTGLALLGVASAAGATVDTERALLLLRAIEGAGFLMVIIPAPGLIKRLVTSDRLTRVLSIWSTYLPTGTAIILVLGAWVLTLSNWRVLWVLLAVLAACMFLLLWRFVPSDHDLAPSDQPEAPVSWAQQALTTLASGRVWLVGISFGLYTLQWSTVIGFLPTIYHAVGVSGMQAGVFTAIAAGANLLGNLAAGRILQRGGSAVRLLQYAFAVMAVCGWVAFGLGVSALWQLFAVVVFSAVGGLIPSILFILAVHFAPSRQTTPTTVGLVQQCNAVGQFVGPPLVAVVASIAAGWQLTWTVTASCAILGMFLASRIGVAYKRLK